jgi:hypothetical protein
MTGWKKLSPSMIEALRVLRIQGSVWSGARWERGVGYVKSGTVCALIERDLIMRSPQGEWVATRKGYFAMAAEKLITFDAAEQEQNDLDEYIDELHAEALGMSTTSQSTSIQRAEHVLKKLANKPQVVVPAAPTEPVSSITVANGQRWLCVKGRDKGKLIELEYVATRAPLWWYRNLSARRVRHVVGRITEAELHARWELRNCEHEEVIDDCATCWCPFHGVAAGQCTCNPKRSK